MDRTTKIIISAVVVLGGVGMLVYTSMADAEFYKHVHEVMAEPDAWAGKTLRVHGFVEPGSIHEKIEDQTTTRTFVLQSPCGDSKVAGCKPGITRRLLVHHHGPTPDTFKSLAEVVAKGTLEKKGSHYVLEADELMAKCPSKYEQTERPSEYGKQGQASSSL